MGFPNSIFSFTTKSAGQTIQSASMNDAQNEIAAIETALITGPITLPASTVASLSVTGGSTLAGTLTAGASTLASVNVTGPSTLVGAVTCSAGLTVNGGFMFGGLRLGSTFVSAVDSTRIPIDSTHGVLFMSAAALSTIHGLSQGVGGQVLFIVNTAANAVTLKSQSVTTASSNRLISTGDVTIVQHQGRMLVYDPVSVVWRVLTAGA